MELFDRNEFRKNRIHRGPRRWPRTSTGRIVEVKSVAYPKKGDVFLKPTQQRGIYQVVVAQNDYSRHYYSILK